MGHVGEPFLPLQPAKVQDCVKFGDGFELDLGAGRLSRSGRVLKLERIPMEILLLLVQQRGELVTREQIVERVWGKDIYLDTDNSINGAIRKIRQVLKDDPEQPRFIQTITGKGYRFIAPIADPMAPAPIVLLKSYPPAAALSVKPARSKWLTLLAASIIVAIGTAAYFWFHSQ